MRVALVGVDQREVELGAGELSVRALPAGPGRSPYWELRLRLESTDAIAELAGDVGFPALRLIAPRADGSLLVVSYDRVIVDVRGQRVSYRRDDQRTFVELEAWAAHRTVIA